MTIQSPEILHYDGKELRLSPFPEVRFDHPRIIPNPFRAVILKYGGDDFEMLKGPVVPWWGTFLNSAKPEEIEMIKASIQRYSASPWAKAELEGIISAPQCGLYASSGCRRNYIGKWTIVDGVLNLAHLSFRWGGRVLDGPKPIPATWVSGIFVGQYGNEVREYPLGRMQREHAKLFAFKRGRLVRYEDVSPDYIPPVRTVSRRGKFTWISLAVGLAIALVASLVGLAFLL